MLNNPTIVRDPRSTTISWRGFRITVFVSRHHTKPSAIYVHPNSEATVAALGHKDVYEYADVVKKAVHIWANTFSESIPLPEYLDKSGV